VKRRSILFPSSRAAELHEESLPPLGPGKALVETIVSAISSGSELLVYRGQAPEELAVDETITALDGAFGFPIKYGYAAVGRVIDIGPGATSEDKTYWLGRLVFAFNPHETYFQAAMSDLHPLPPGLTPEAAVFLPNMETAVSWVMDGRPVIGEQVALLGQGVIGLLTTALLAGLPLAGLVTFDAHTLRRDWSERLGATIVFDPHVPGALDQARQGLEGQKPYAGADLTYELSGNPQALDMAIALTGYNGRVVIGSWYGRKRVQLDLGGQFHRSHMTLIASQVSTIAPRWRGRWTQARRLGVAWAMIEQHQPQRLITHRFPVEQAAEAYRLLDEQPGEVVQVIFTHSND
jgi:2-desacetyl-2-hydroxyethyl bacteriochlorophyllide A dehydrogenase